MQKEVLATIKLAGAICSQRTQSDLVANIKAHLPDYFGFEAAGVLLRDVKTDYIFSVNELSKDEATQVLRAEFRASKEKERQRAIQRGEKLGPPDKDALEADE